MAVTLTSTGITFSDGSSLATGSMIKSIQTIFINVTGTSTTGGDYTSYKDVVMSAVTNTAKCVVHYHPGALNINDDNYSSFNGTAVTGLVSWQGSSQFPVEMSITFPNTTTLRLNGDILSTYSWVVKGRITIVEYA